MANKLMWLAINAYHEARGESFAGKVAVCHVVLNRCRARKMGAKGVILQAKQFSWANGGARPPIKNYEAFVRCAEAAKICLDQRIAGATLNKADHYFANYIDPPWWAVQMEKVAEIGKHIFYRSKRV